MFKKFRIAVLLFILLNVAFGAWLAKARMTDWDKPLKVVIYAINGDGSTVSKEYIDKLISKDGEEIEAFFADIEDLRIGRITALSAEIDLKSRPAVVRSR